VSARYTLYGTTISPFVRKVRVAMALKGVAYDYEPLNVFDPPAWFAKVNPLKRIPILRDNERGATLADSSAICGYLERAYPTPPLMPADPWDAGRVLFLEEYADTDFGYRLGMGVFRARFVNPRIGKPVDEALAQKTLAETAPRFFDYLEAELGGRAHFVGDTLTLADISIATHLVGFRYGGEEVDASRWPALAAFARTMFAHPAFASLLAEEARDLGL
jgi:glutathione S-transferase